MTFLGYSNGANILASVVFAEMNVLPARRDWAAAGRSDTTAAEAAIERKRRRLTMRSSLSKG